MNVLKYTKQRGKYKYRLDENVFYLTLIKGCSGHIISNDGGDPWVKISTDGTIEIRAGYNWDGASGAIDTESFMRGSLIHDALYQLMRESIVYLTKRKDSDLTMKKVNLESDMFPFRAKYTYFFVRLLGKKYAKPSK